MRMTYVVIYNIFLGCTPLSIQSQLSLVFHLWFLYYMIFSFCKRADSIHFPGPKIFDNPPLIDSIGRYILCTCYFIFSFINVHFTWWFIIHIMLICIIIKIIDYTDSRHKQCQVLRGPGQICYIWSSAML